MGSEYFFGFNSENSVSEFFANFLVLAVVPCVSRSPSWISPPALFFFRFATEDIGSRLISGFSGFAVDFLALWFVNLFHIGSINTASVGRLIIVEYGVNVFDR
jgi:hypothetical protein